MDVPGHERFVRTMVAGATGIDLFLMVIAADDGVMPQTREHGSVLQALGVDAGVVAVTKSDLAPPPSLEGLGDPPRWSPCRRARARGSTTCAPRWTARPRAPSRARRRRGRCGCTSTASFTIRGAGTVVTGTLWSGEAVRGDEVTSCRPAAGPACVPCRSTTRRCEARVGRPAGRAQPRRDPPRRGRPRRRRGRRRGRAGADLPRGRALEWDDPGTRIMVHHGTREAPARAVALGDDVWQLRLEAPIVPLAGDRIVLRAIAPPDTLGGGIVVDPAPRRHAALEPEPAPQAAPARADAAPAPAPSADPLTPSALATEERLRTLAPPPDAELPAHDLALLRAHGRAVRVGPAQHFHADVLDDVRARLIAMLEAEGSVTLARVRDELGSSRRYVQALLEHFDSERVTLRRGDERVLRRRARA